MIQLWFPTFWQPIKTHLEQCPRVEHVEVLLKDGSVKQNVHYAFGDGEGLMPPFDGWFEPVVDNWSGKISFYRQVDNVIGWRRSSAR